MADTQRSIVGRLLQATVPLVILAAGVVAFVLLSKLLKTEPATASESTDVIGVRTARVGRCLDGITIEADGIVVPYREVSLAAEVAGRVSQREDICRAGNFVKAGTLLFTIDSEEYELDAERLQNELKQNLAALDELTEEILGTESLIEISQKQLKLRKRETERWGELATNFRNTAETDLAMMNELAAENALAALQNRSSLLKVSRKRLESTKDLAESKVKRAQLDLKRTKIYAPVDGVVVRDFVEQDSFVQRGTLLMTLEDTSRVEVKCKLEMEDLYWLWDRPLSQVESNLAKGEAAAYGIPETEVEVIYRLTGRNDLEFVWNGVLSRFDGIGLDEKTRTVPCRVVVKDPRRRILWRTEPSPESGSDRENSTTTSAVRPDSRSGPPALFRGMYVTIRFTVKPKTPVLEVPETAVKPGNVVWAVRGGKLAIEPVNFVSLLEPSPQAANDEGADREPAKALVYVDLPGRLTEGDEVVISPLSFVRTGMDVSILGTEKK